MPREKVCDLSRGTGRHMRPVPKRNAAPGRTSIQASSAPTRSPRRAEGGRPRPKTPPPPPPLEGNHSKVIRFLPNFGWKDVPLEDYKADTATWKGITRRELAGKRGESTKFHVRYFEIAPGGHSTLERHLHEHVVVPIRGAGEAQAGCYAWKVSFGDVVYVSPSDPHQFRCPADATEPFGFLCMVNAERDRPTPVDGIGVCRICE